MESIREELGVKVITLRKQEDPPPRPPIIPLKGGSARDKDIPINHHVSDALNSLSRALQHDFAMTYRGIALSNKNSLKKQSPDT